MMSNNYENYRFETRLIHTGEPRDDENGSVVPAIYQSSTYLYPGKYGGKPKYVRNVNTPNQTIVCEKIASLEGTEAGLVTASGMAAISTALLGLVKRGEHLLAQDDLYGGTFQFLKDVFPEMGRAVTLFPLGRGADLKEFLRPNTKAIYVESVSNPLMKIPDLSGIAQFGKTQGLISFIDNTFPSPFNFNPARFGFDVVLHSATKYLNGHSDIMGGAILTSEKHVETISHLLRELGGALDPHSAYLLNRGMKTLSVRMRWQNESALKIAQALSGHPDIVALHYPGLQGHSDHARAKEWFRGFGGVFSLLYKGDGPKTMKFVNALKLPFVAPSLGGVESLVTLPVITSHRGLSPMEQQARGITESLVRVSVGLEDPDDLIEDFLNALEKARA